MRFLITTASGDIDDTEREITTIEQLIKLSEIHEHGIVIKKMKHRIIMRLLMR